MKYIFNNTQDWLAKRRTVLTATEASCLFGINPYKNVIDMVNDKMNPVDLSDNPFVWAGHIYEPGLVLKVNDLLHMDFRQIGGAGQEIEFHVHDKVALGASPDALNGDKDVLLECKSASMSLFKTWEAGRVPKHYDVQVRVQMACMGLKKAFIACIGRPPNFKSLLKDLFEGSLGKPRIESRWKNILTITENLNKVVVLEVVHCQEKEDIIISETQRFWDCVFKEEEFVINQEYKELFK